MRNDDHRDHLSDLSAQGVAVWLDDLSRELLAGGRLKSLIADRHVESWSDLTATIATELHRNTPQ
jgi:hypothetical protein